MHPDLFMRIYQQQERELEQRLMHRLAARERSTAGRRPAHHGHTVHLHLPRRGAQG